MVDGVQLREDERWNFFPNKQDGLEVDFTSNMSLLPSENPSKQAYGQRIRL